MAFLSEEQIAALGFKHVGRDVKISDKAAIYSADQIEIGDHSRIDDFCVVSGRVSIGRNVHVTIMCNIAGGVKGITLADYSTVAYGCHLFSQSDDYSGGSMTNSTIPREFKSEKFAAVHVGKFAIIGARSVILPGVEIGEGTSIGAMSLVTRSTRPWAIYFGVPAKFQGEKERQPLELVLKYEEKYDSL